jgi:hypothetical protein
MPLAWYSLFRIEFPMMPSGDGHLANRPCILECVDIWTLADHVEAVLSISGYSLCDMAVLGGPPSQICRNDVRCFLGSNRLPSRNKILLTALWPVCGHPATLSPLCGNSATFRPFAGHPATLSPLCGNSATFRPFAGNLATFLPFQEGACLFWT